MTPDKRNLEWREKPDGWWDVHRHELWGNVTIFGKLRDTPRRIGTLYYDEKDQMWYFETESVMYRYSTETLTTITDKINTLSQSSRTP